MKWFFRTLGRSLLYWVALRIVDGLVKNPRLKSNLRGMLNAGRR